MRRSKQIDWTKFPWAFRYEHQIRRDRLKDRLVLEYVKRFGRLPPGLGDVRGAEDQWYLRIAHSLDQQADLFPPPGSPNF